MDAWEQAEVEIFRGHPFATRHTALYRYRDGDHIERTGTLYWKKVHDFDLPEIASSDDESVSSITNDLNNLQVPEELS